MSLSQHAVRIFNEYNENVAPTVKGRRLKKMWAGIPPRDRRELLERMTLRIEAAKELKKDGNKSPTIEEIDEHTADGHRTIEQKKASGTNTPS